MIPITFPYMRVVHLMHLFLSMEKWMDEGKRIVVYLDDRSGCYYIPMILLLCLHGPLCHPLSFFFFPMVMICIGGKVAKWTGRKVGLAVGSMVAWQGVLFSLARKGRA